MKKTLIPQSSALVFCALLFISGFSQAYASSVVNTNTHHENTLNSILPENSPTAYPENNQKDVENTLCTTYQFTQPIITTDGGYQHITMDGLSTITTPGKPMLPFQTIKVLLPQHTTVASITVERINDVRIGAGFRIKEGEEPSIETGLTSTQDKPTTNEPSGTATLYPAEPYTLIGTYTQRGYTYVIVNLYPVRYLAQTGEVWYTKELRMTITLSHTSMVNPFFRGVEKDTLLTEQSSADTFGAIETYTDTPHQSTLCDLPSEQFDYVIITTEALRTAFQPFIDYKNAHGTRTCAMTVEEITSTPAYWVDGTWGDGTLYGQDNPMFNDTAAQIRNFIRFAYATWGVEYVLLGGDAPAVVPARVLYLGYYDEFLNFHPSGEYFGPSDVYFSCLDGTFNSNEDRYWGNSTDGAGGSDVDLLSEVYVGRACVNTPEEVGNFILKTRGYEETNDPYLRNVTMASEYEWGDGTAMNELIDGSYDSGFSTVGIPSDTYNISTLYDDDYIGNQYCLGWQPEDLISRINNGVHIINHLGHSGITYNMKLYNFMVDNLTNTKYCFIYSQGCEAGAFENNDSIAEHFTVRTPHGAFAGIWNVNFGMPSCALCLQRQFWDAIFGESASKPYLHELGPANQNSKEENLGFINGAGALEHMRWAYYEVELFGDPQLAIKSPDDPPAHDLCVYHFTVGNHLHVAANEIVPLQATIANNGQTDEQNVHISFSIDTIPVGSQEIVDLPSGSRETISFNCSFQPGEHVVSVQVDPCEGEENTENNNANITVIAGSDIAVSVVAVPAYVYTDENNVITAVFTNLGVDAVTDIQVHLFVDEAVVASLTIPLLSPNQQITVSFDWTPQRFLHWYSFAVTADPVPGEVMVEDNRFNYGHTVRTIHHTVYVKQDGTADFTTITDAISVVGPHDTVFVHSGIYDECLTIIKPITVIGENKEMTIIFNRGPEPNIYIQSDDVTLSGFNNQRLYCFQQDSFTGIQITGTNVNVSNNIITNSYIGIQLRTGIADSIFNNSISECPTGIRIDTSSYENVIANNVISTIEDEGISVFGFNNSIYQNSLINIDWGTGIVLNYLSSGNSIAKNFFSDVCYEIFIERASNNLIIENTLTTSNYGIGIYCDNCQNNKIYHNNFLNHGCNVYEYGGSNQWDNGYPSGGNYWDDYTGEDINNDGIGDTPYGIPEGTNQDHYPLMQLNGWILPSNVPPIAAFTYTPEHPTDMQVILFTDASADSDGTITAWNWDFGDNTISTEKNPSHQYTEDGTYLVSLNITDNNGAYTVFEQTIVVSNNPPQARINLVPNEPTDHDTVFFFDASTDSDGTIVTWVWDFGDGCSSTEQNPTHRYMAQGDYSVSLTVTDDDGDTNTSFQTLNVLHVNLPPAPPETPNGPGTGYMNTDYEFTSITTDPEGGFVWYCWDWGDGTISGWYGPYHSNSEVYASHAWMKEATYSIRIKAQDSNGAESGLSDPCTIQIQYHDTCSPTIEFKPVTTAILGKDVLLHATITDDHTKIPKALVDYRAVTKDSTTNHDTTPWTTLPLQYDEQEQLFCGMISASEIRNLYTQSPTHCFEYRFRAVDDAGNEAVTKTITVKIIDQNPNGVGAP